ncbi:MAG: hypothetical protein K2V38_24775 [Gemmataceae bacterium]|nr:hypothetical protein [Gemmataceae bacterium]
MKLFAIITAGLMTVGAGVYFATECGTCSNRGCNLPVATSGGCCAAKSECSTSADSGCGSCADCATACGACCAVCDLCCATTTAKVSKSDCCATKEVCCVIGAACCESAVAAAKPREIGACCESAPSRTTRTVTAVGTSVVAGVK